MRWRERCIFALVVGGEQRHRVERRKLSDRL